MESRRQRLSTLLALVGAVVCMAVTMVETMAVMDPVMVQRRRLLDRANAFNISYQQWPASWLRMSQEQGRPALYGTWVIGNDYRNQTRYYGAYPRGYVDRVMALFPEVGGNVLHVFSGSMPEGNYARCDIAQPAEYQCSVYDMPTRAHGFRWPLVMADPPYTSEDARRYGTPMVNRGKAMRALSEIVEPGGYLAWLDTVWPMHRKDQWLTVGRITVIRSTNHRVRLLSLFERVS